MTRLEKLEQNIKTLQRDLKCCKREEVICLNTATPAFAPEDILNPTTDEVQAWVEANLTTCQQNGGTHISYFQPAYNEDTEINLEVTVDPLAETIITSFIVNGDELIVDPITVIDSDPLFVYTDELAVLFAAWLLLHPEVEATFDDTDLVNGNITITDIFSDLIVTIGYTYDGDPLETTDTVLMTEAVGTCEDPLFVWVLSQDGNITRIEYNQINYIDSFANFPAIGIEEVLYVDLSTGDIYIWDGIAYVTADSSSDDMLVAKTIYVDATYGSDTTGTRENANLPFLTIAAAIAAASDGDTLHIYPGDYTTSASTTKALHIYCEDGVTWTYTSTFMSSITNPQKLKWRFDTLTTSTFGLFFTTAGNFEIDLHINHLLQGRVLFGGSLNSTIRSHEAYIDVCEDCFVRFDTYRTTNLTPASNLKINTLINSGTAGTSVSFINADYAVSNINVDNVQYSGSILQDQVIGAAASSNDGATTLGYKSYNLVLNNVKAVTSVALPAHNNVFDAATVWIGTTANNVYGQICRDLLNNANSSYNLILKNVISYRHGVLLLGSPQADTNIKGTYNISGTWYRGIPIYTGYLSTFTNSIITINLDVVVEDSTGIYFGAYDIGNALNDINATNTIIVTGRIKTKKVGFPCITIQGNTNNTIVLKDLTLINDGTVSPIMTNYGPGNNINIQNVVTNSLVVDPLITEIGQPIVRNINYK